MSNRGLYIYEIIHTLRGESKLLDLHVSRANEAILNIFNIKECLNESDLRAEIEEFIEQNRAPQRVSVYLRLEIYSSGEHTLSIEEISIYQGYTLRCFEPRATVVAIEVPYHNYSTAAREHTSYLELIEAQRVGGDIALRCSSNGDILAANNSPLFAVINGVIHSSLSGINSAEQQMIYECANDEFEIVNRAIMASNLHLYDELFYVDHYGITAIKSVGNRLYLNAISSKLALLISKI